MLLLTHTQFLSLHIPVAAALGRSRPDYLDRRPQFAGRLLDRRGIPARSTADVSAKHNLERIQAMADVPGPFRGSSPAADWVVHVPDADGDAAGGQLLAHQHHLPRRSPRRGRAAGGPEQADRGPRGRAGAVEYAHLLPAGGEERLFSLVDGMAVWDVPCVP